MELYGILTFFIVLVSSFEFCSTYNQGEAAADIMGMVIPRCMFSPGEISIYQYLNDVDEPLEFNPDDRDMQIYMEPSKKSICITVHGFHSDANSTMFRRLARACGQRFNAITFSVNWRKGACTEGIALVDLPYYFPNAVMNAMDIAQKVTRFIGRLVTEYGYSTKDMIMCGHSLGAQIASYTAKAMQSHQIGKLYALIALDPVGLIFEFKGPDQRVDITDAEKVIVLHTSLAYGLSQPVGTIDYYFNGGHFQPGCSYNQYCAHVRALDYWFLAMQTPTASHCIARRWNRRMLLPPNDPCTITSCNTVGPESLESPVTGVFYVTSDIMAPFCESKFLFISKVLRSGIRCDITVPDIQCSNILFVSREGLTNQSVTLQQFWNLSDHRERWVANKL